MPAQVDIEHLLRRTEFVARPWRVQELTGKPSLAAAVDDILATGGPGTVSYATNSDWEHNFEYTHFWFDRMAFDSPRPIQEKIAFFWQGHFPTSLQKVLAFEPMRHLIDIYRYEGLGNLRSLAIRMSTQPAMLRYLDNNKNLNTLPNQNFARELMELFLLGVGNYTEADVEAGTAAWSGHTESGDAAAAYSWRPDWHDASVKSFLGRSINAGADQTRHGAETIEVMLGNGIVPAGASNVANRGRATRLVAAEFVSRKLWRFFAGPEPSSAVVAALRDVAIANDFAIRPWVRALLLRPEFYTNEVKQGLVRSPVDLMVAYLFHTGMRSSKATPLWWLEGMGQHPLYPPDVSGWRNNAVFVNAGAMAQRSLAARQFMWQSWLGFWAGDGLIHLGAGTISRAEAEAMAGQPDQFVDVLLSKMMLPLTPASREVMYAHSRASQWFERLDLVGLALLAPEVHVA